MLSLVMVVSLREVGGPGISGEGGGGLRSFRNENNNIQILILTLRNLI